jgi:biopolymer transport protein ExbB/TolQ
MNTGTLAHNIEQVIYYSSKLLLYPVLITAIVCLLWVLVELGWFLYEAYLRARYRDLEALETRTLRAREAFANGQPRKAYRYLQENNYSMVVVKFLFDLIRNYQTQRLSEKPLKLLQEYEFYTIKRLEKTRILVRVGPILGLMGTLIPLSPALTGLAHGNYAVMAANLKIAFSVTVLGLLIGGLAFMISVFRDRMYSQDISDLEYVLELLEGNGKRLKSGQVKTGKKHGRKARHAEEEAAAGEAEAADEEGEADVEGEAEVEGAGEAEAAADEEGAPEPLAVAPEGQTTAFTLDELERGLEEDLVVPEAPADGVAGATRDAP